MQKSPAKGSPRRVLGDISPNKRIASPQRFNKPARPGQDNKASHSTTTTKNSAQNFMPAALLPPKASFPAPSSNKRSFDAVETTGVEESFKRRHVPQSPLRQTHTLSSTVMGFNTAQTRRPVPPPQERDSDETDDEIIVLPPPPHPISASQETVPMPSQSQTDHSFSSLIDYGETADPSERQSNNQQTSISPDLFLHSADGSFSAAPLTRAETLKLRLQMAMYRVSTDQLHIPISDLRVPTLSRRIKNISSQENLRRTTSSTPNSKQTPFGRSSAAPKLLPAPLLVPAEGAPSSSKIEYEVDETGVDRSDGSLSTPMGSKRFHDMFVVSEGVGSLR